MTAIEFLKITALFLLFATAIVSPSYINRWRRSKMTKRDRDEEDQDSEREMSIW